MSSVHAPGERGGWHYRFAAGVIHQIFQRGVRGDTRREEGEVLSKAFSSASPCVLRVMSSIQESPRKVAYQRYLIQMQTQERDAGGTSVSFALQGAK